MNKAVCTSLVLKVASRCNLNCTYCYMYNAGDTTYLHQPKVMHRDTVKAICRAAGEHCRQHRLGTFEFIFHGGEPLLAGRAFYSDFVNQVKEHFPPDTRVRYSMQTNGILLNESWCDLLASLGITVGISLDGDETANDLHRVDHKGRGSYKRVLAGIRQIQRHPLLRHRLGILTVIDTSTSTKDLYRHIKDLDIRQFNVLLPYGTYDAPPPGVRLPYESDNAPSRRSQQPSGSNDAPAPSPSVVHRKLPPVAQSPSVPHDAPAPSPSVVHRKLPPVAQSPSGPHGTPAPVAQSPSVPHGTPAPAAHRTHAAAAPVQPPETRSDRSTPNPVAHRTHAAPAPAQPTIYADWLIELFDHWFEDERRPAIPLFSRVMGLLLGLGNEFDYFGRGDIQYLVIETDGSIEPSGALKICGNGFTKIGLDIHRHGLDEALAKPLIRRYHRSHQQLPDKCRRCPLRRICGGGHLPTRFSQEKGFDNPSLYCLDYMKLITHIQQRLWEVLPASVTAKMSRISFRQMQKFHEAYHSSRKVYEA